MREFVQAISAQAKKADPAFLVVPQGGVGLLTDKEKPAAEYLKAIDGIGQEEIFYGFDNKDNRKTPKKETDNFLKQLAVAKAAGKPVLSIDYASKREFVDDAYAKNATAGFVPFVADRRGLDGVPKYPEKPVNEKLMLAVLLQFVASIWHMVVSFLAFLGLAACPARIRPWSCAARAYALGNVTPLWPWYLPPRSL